jgi:hypothetical protein
MDSHRWNPNERPTDMPPWLWWHVGLSPENFDASTGNVVIETANGKVLAVPGDLIVKESSGNLTVQKATK